MFFPSKKLQIVTSAMIGLKFLSNLCPNRRDLVGLVVGDTMCVLIEVVEKGNVGLNQLWAFVSPLIQNWQNFSFCQIVGFESALGLRVPADVAKFRQMAWRN